MRKAKDDLTGRKFGRLTVIKQADTWGVNGISFWVCLCSCGKEHTVARNILIQEVSKSCGCLNLELVRNRAKINSLPEGEAGFRHYLAQIKHAAKKRNYVWELKDEEVKELNKQNCFYCGSEPKQKYKAKSGPYVYNGLDRVDNSKGYNRFNVVPCCGLCNRAKSNMEQSVFESWILQAAETIKNRKFNATS